MIKFDDDFIRHCLVDEWGVDILIGVEYNDLINGKWIRLEREEIKSIMEKVKEKKMTEEIKLENGEKYVYVGTAMAKDIEALTLMAKLLDMGYSSNEVGMNMRFLESKRISDRRSTKDL